MSVITDEYRDLNKELHERRKDYGVSGKKWAGQVVDIASAMGASSILDYGCGKGTLGAAIPHMLVIGYDPAIDGMDESPEPADLVVCTDVLEHVEPDCVEDVLNDLRRCSIKGIFMTVATRPAAKFLADGRNAHLIQEGANWWLPKIMARWDLKMFQATDGEFAAFCTAKKTNGAGQ